MAMAAAIPVVCLGAPVRSVLDVRNGGRRKLTARVVTQLQRSRDAVGGALRRLNQQHSKVVQIRILQQLLNEQDLLLALPLYKSLQQKDWYKWNPNLHAQLVALLATSENAEALVSDIPGSLSKREEVNLQVCLIENYAKIGLLDKVLTTFQGLQSHPLPSAGYLSHQALIRAYISLDLPHEAYLILEVMRNKVFKPCLDDYKALIHAFGRSGNIAKMEKLVQELHETGLKLDKSGFNMMLSAYGQAQKFECVVETLEDMRKLNISCSVNARNAISKSCPNLIFLFEGLEEFPPNVDTLFGSLELRGIADGELNTVKELLNLGLAPDSVRWAENVWELDLHQMFLGTAYISLFLWLQQLKAQSIDGNKFPLEIRVITGWGKHSDIEGRSVMREKVRQLLERMKSPFRADRHNQGALLCRASSLKVWLKIG